MKIKISTLGEPSTYWGPGPLPAGAELCGIVTRNDTDVGALVRLASGEYVQGNAGATRSLPQRPVLGGLAAGALSRMHTGVKERPSAKKALTSRENGKKGGRPRRVVES